MEKAAEALLEKGFQFLLLLQQVVKTTIQSGVIHVVLDNDLYRSTW
jgi:hypothetical protein